MHLQRYYLVNNSKEKDNENGYVKTYSLKNAEKTATITQCWESMISNT